MKLLLSPHSDDSVLFAAFTVQREKCQVVTVFDSYVQVKRGFPDCSKENRRDEDIQACKALGVDPPIFLGFDDSEKITPYLEESIIVALKRRFKTKDIEAVWCPAEEDKGHQQHNLVSRACRAAFGGLVKNQYLTYQMGDGLGKTISSKLVPVQPQWVYPKIKALACYASQIDIPALGCWPHFIRSQYEYYL